MRTLLRVVRTPTRRRRLLRFGPLGLARLARFLTTIVPRASRELDRIRARAAAIPDPTLRGEALASIAAKAYHVQGGSILATFLPAGVAPTYVAAVAALETIYDYLDNVCDRLDGVPEDAFATLHGALADAVDPSRAPGAYYRDGPLRDDGGYLRGLVAGAQAALAALPGLDAVRAELAEAVRYYAELQTFKHFAPGRREDACRAWYERHRARFPELAWWEFAAACGSSLPVFALLYRAARPRPAAGDVGATFAAYFPDVSAVHILLDYFIDQAEDREHHELNFVACYPSQEAAVSGLARLTRRAAASVRTLPDAEVHAFLLDAMTLFYLSHPKVFEQRLEAAGTRILHAAG